MRGLDIFLILIISCLPQLVKAQGCNQTASTWSNRFAYPGVHGADVQASVICNDILYLAGKHNTYFGRHPEYNALSAFDGEVFRGIGKLSGTKCGGTPYIFAAATNGDNHVYFAGRFNAVIDSAGNTVTSPNIIGFNTNTGSFFPIGKGLDSDHNFGCDARDVVFRNDTLFVVGEFNQAIQNNNSTVNTSHIAGYDLNADLFFDLDGGLHTPNQSSSFGGLHAICLGENNLIYTGGDASEYDNGSDFSGVSAWHPVSGWQSVGFLPNKNFINDDIPAKIYDLTWDSNTQTLYASGFFSTAYDNDFRYLLARFENQQWSLDPNFVYESSGEALNRIEKIYLDPAENRLFVGGSFLHKNIIDEQDDRLAIIVGHVDLSDQSFTSLIEKVQEDGIFPGEAFDINFYKNEYYFIGDLGGAHGVRALGVVAWDNQDFRALGHGIGSTSGNLFCGTHYGGKLIFGGSAEDFGWIRNEKIAYWDETEGWTPFEYTIAGSNNEAVYALHADGDELWIGGDFEEIDGQSAYGLARVNVQTQNLTLFGSGVSGSGAVIYAIQRFKNKVYIAGDFSNIDGISCSGIAVFDGNNFSEAFELGGNEIVKEMLVLGDSLLVVAGDFNEVDGDNDYHNLFAFDGSQKRKLWTNGVNGPVEDLAFNETNGRIEIVGSFTQVYDLNQSQINLDAPAIAISTLGEIFEKTGLQFDNPSQGISAVQVLSDGSLAYGGNFTLVNGTDYGKIFRWDAGQITDFDGDLKFVSGGVHELVLDGQDLWILGAVYEANGLPSCNLARHRIANNGNGTLVVDMIPLDSINHYDVLHYCIPSPEDGAAYEWSNGSTGACAIIEQSGWLRITATAFSCYAPDSVYVTITYPGYTRGGYGDGYDDNEFIQQESTLYLGGYGDGYDHDKQQNLDPTFFAGGYGDGYDHDAYHSESSFYTGGYGDGFDCTLNKNIDLETKNLKIPGNQPTNGKQSLTVWLVNHGQQTIDEVDITLLENGEHYFDYPLSLELAPGDSINHKLEQQWLGSENGNFELCVVAKVIGDGNASNDTTCITAISTVGIEEIIAHQLSIYPNPSKGWLSVQSPKALKSVSISIVDAQGRSIREESWIGPQERFMINMSSIASGVYQLQISSGNYRGTYSIIKSK